MLNYFFSVLRQQAPARPRRAADFHFCRLFKGDTHQLALARHQHYLCAMLGLRPGMRVLHIGAGTGDAALELVRYADVEVVSTDADAEKVEYATRRARDAGLASKISFVHANLEDLTNALPAASFDAIFAIESLKIAESFESIYAPLSTLLKQGGRIGTVEWCWTAQFDAEDADHARLAATLEASAGLAERAPNGRTMSAACAALERAGLAVRRCEDLAARVDRIPWHAPLEAALADGGSPWQGAGDMACATGAFGGLSRDAAGVLVQAAKWQLFTPMAVFIAEKVV